MNAAPLVIEFVPGTRLYREAAFTTGLVLDGAIGQYRTREFPDGHRVPLPTDQVVAQDDHRGAARVGFGGMRFIGLQNGQLVFHRIKDLWPAAQLSPERGVRMTLEVAMVAAILVDGAQVWPEPVLLN